MPVNHEAVIDGEDSFTLTLRRPVKITFAPADGPERVEEVTSITIRNGDAGDLLVTDKIEGEVAKTIALIAHLTGQPAKVIRKLHPQDFAILGEKAQGF